MLVFFLIKASHWMDVTDHLIFYELNSACILIFVLLAKYLKVGFKHHNVPIVAKMKDNTAIRLCIIDPPMLYSH